MDGTTASGVVRAEYHQFWLLGTGDFPVRVPGPTNGLVDALPGAAVVHTGISAGAVSVAVSAHPGPPAVEAGGWDDIVEVSLPAVPGPLRVASLKAPPHDLPPLTTAGGDWRVRVHARGRDTDVDGVAREPFEHYLVQVWPAAPAPETAHRLTDGYGAGLRGSGLPPV